MNMNCERSLVACDLAMERGRLCLSHLYAFIHLYGLNSGSGNMEEHLSNMLTLVERIEQELDHISEFITGNLSKVFSQDHVTEKAVESITV